jgi:uncharacterized membrane protein
MKLAMKRMPINQFKHTELTKAGQDQIVLTSPDIIYSASAFDISKKPIQISLVIPENDTYWSISFFDEKTVNFFIMNDLEVKNSYKSRQIELFLKTKNTKFEPPANPNARVINAPSEKGIILIRMIVKEPKNQAELEKLYDTQRKNRISIL